MSYDIVIKNGYVIDGSGNPWFKADVGLLNGTIVKIGKISACNARKVIDAEGMILRN
jgi:N-acyl-D-amino-acid deacylase